MTAPTLAHPLTSERTPSPGAPGEVLSGVLAGLSELHEFVAVCDEQRRVRWISDRLGIAGSDSAERLGEPLDDLFPAPARLDLAAITEQAATPFGVGRARVQLRAEGGPAIDVALSAFQVPAEPGLTVVVARRSEEAERSETALRANADYLAAVLDCAPDAVVATDRSGFVAYVNPAACELFGSSAEELTGRPAVSCLAVTTGAPALLAAVRKGDVKGQILEVGCGEHRRWLSLSSRRLRLPNSNASGNVFHLRDVTDYHQMQVELQAKADELEHYVAHVSHDLRTPLSSVLGFARILRQDFEEQLGSKGRKFLERIEQGGNTMEALITDLLELSRIGHGDRDELVDPLPILKKISADWKEHLDAQHVEIELPESPPMLLCNRTRLYQVFANLIGNALVHMGPRVDARVRVEIEEIGQQHRISVRDNGKGIALEHQARIFDVFATLGRRTDGRKSTGIGLAIVRKIATLHGGRVWVESQLDRGATFYITLDKG